MKKWIRIIAVMMLCVLLMPYAFADDGLFYNAADVKIGVGGTGAFYMKEAGRQDNEYFMSINADGYGEFQLSIQEPGTYRYEIFGTGAINTKRYDVIVFAAADDPDNPNTLSTLVTLTPQGKEQKMSTAYYPVSGDPPLVVKQIDGKNAPANAHFEFEMRAKSTTAEGLSGNMPMPEGSNGQVKIIPMSGEGDNEFGTIYFDRAGEYVYEIKERMTGVPGFDYDQTNYTVIFTITEGTKGLEKQMEVKENDRTIDSGAQLLFINKYNKNNNVNPDPNKGPIKTGDSTNWGLWFAVFVGSVIAGAGVTIVFREMGGKPKVL